MSCQDSFSRDMVACYVVLLLLVSSNLSVTGVYVCMYVCVFGVQIHRNSGF